MNEILAVDFDGTLCEHEFPRIGSPRTELIELLKELKSKGAKLILWTCREGQYLEDALKWCDGFGLTFDSVNTNPAPLRDGLANRKVHAHLYIDDRAISPSDFLKAAALKAPVQA